LRRRPDLQEYFGIPEDVSFPDYISAISLSDHVQVMPQVAFLHDANGAPLVDFVGRFENLADDAGRIFGQIGLDGTALEHHNRSMRESDYRPYYTPETKDRVAELYADDIRVFGYEF
jgi:hypothetical protein